MVIGIDGSRAFIKNRTGIEEYSYQVIKHLRDELGDKQACLPMKQIVLYIRKNQEIDFEIPKNWKVKVIKFPRFWTQLGLSLEMLLHPVDVLFIPAHTVPLVHPEKTVVVMHGLEYEFCPKAYSLWDRIYMRASIKSSCRWAKTIISVSNNTKLDLMRLYGVKKDKVCVIYEGYDCNFQSVSNDQFSILNTKYGIQDTKYLLFVGRIEERKNIINIIKAFEILKEKYDILHKLVLAGKPGFGYEGIKYEIRKTKYIQDILELGFVSEEEKWELLKNADVFVFPTQYEGFGIPILEAQSIGCAVVAANNSSIPEVVSQQYHSERISQQDDESRNLSARSLDFARDDTCSALLVDPFDPNDIAENIYKLISNEKLKSGIIGKGLENVKRFSWEKCAQEISSVLLK